MTKQDMEKMEKEAAHEFKLLKELEELYIESCIEGYWDSGDWLDDFPEEFSLE